MLQIYDNRLFFRNISRRFVSLLTKKTRMASKRYLKKSIQFIFSNLLTECYTASVLFPKISEEKLAETIAKIINKNDELTKRAGRPDGKENSRRVQLYYNKLQADLSKSVTEIADDIDKLYQSK